MDELAKKQKHVFESEGLACEGVLFLPSRERPPVIILGHGFGAEWTFGTSGFIEAFVERAGAAVFAFDYRTFGASEGKPRQYVHPERHCEDWRNAVAYVRSLPNVNGSQIALWGSSYSGGHVLVTAAADPNILGVIAQVPFCSSREGALPFLVMLRAICHGFLDLLCSLVGREHMVPLLGEPGGAFAMLDVPGWKEKYLRLVEASGSSTWTNSAPARGIFAMASYNPIDKVSSITCPVLIISGKDDPAIPSSVVQETVAKIPKCQHHELNMGHFEIYDGFPFHKQAVSLELAFLKEIFPDTL